MTAPFTLDRLQDALVCLNDLHAAITLQTQDMGADRREIVHGLLTDLANNVGCTVKPDKPHLVEMQRTERMITSSMERHGAHIRAEAQNAAYLRQQLAEARATIDRQASIIADRDTDYAKLFGEHEALRISFGGLEAADEILISENANLHMVLDRQASARSREAA